MQTVNVSVSVLLSDDQANTLAEKGHIVADNPQGTWRLDSESIRVLARVYVEQAIERFAQQGPPSMILTCTNGIDLPVPPCPLCFDRPGPVQCECCLRTGNSVNSILE